MTAALFPDLVVNGEVIAHAAIAAETQNHAAPKGKPGIAWRKAANALALRALLLQEARRRGLTPEPAELEPGRFETEEEALIRALLEGALEPEAPQEEAIRAEWARDPGRFRAPPLWEVSHILIACDPRDPAAKAAAETRAKDIAARLQAGPGSFARIAGECSDCGSRENGGRLGQIRPGDTVPEFEVALRGLAEGAITPEPVASRHGWHLIRLDAAAPGAPLPYEAARPRIREAMEKAAWAAAARRFTERLLARATITGADLGAAQTRGHDT